MLGNNVLAKVNAAQEETLRNLEAYRQRVREALQRMRDAAREEEASKHNA